MSIRNRGATLVELLVALVLGAIVVGLFTHSVTAQRRSERRVTGAAARASAADEALEVLVAALDRVSAADTLIVRGDTAIEWRAVVGVAVACAAGGDSVVVPDTGSAAWWESSPDSTDRADMADSAGRWMSRPIVSVRTLASGGVCGAAQRTLRLGAGGAVVPTPLVRVTRRVRFMPYKGGDGLWWLGSRTCGDGVPVHCDAAQPVTGPLAPPPSGVRFAIDSLQGRRTIAISVLAGNVARSVKVELRP